MCVIYCDARNFASLYEKRKRGWVILSLKGRSLNSCCTVLVGSTNPYIPRMLKMGKNLSTSVYCMRNCMFTSQCFSSKQKESWKCSHLLVLQVLTTGTIVLKQFTQHATSKKVSSVKTKRKHGWIVLQVLATSYHTKLQPFAQHAPIRECLGPLLVHHLLVQRNLNAEVHH